MDTVYIKFTEGRSAEGKDFISGRVYSLSEGSANHWLKRSVAVPSSKKEFDEQSIFDEEAAAQTAADKKAAEEAEEKKAKEAAAQTAADKKAAAKNADTDAKANK